MIEFGCKNCGQKLSVQDQHSGKRVKCPKCGNVCVVPDNSDKIKFHCKNCGQSISVPQIYAGKKGKCPKCKNPVVVPSLKKEPADGVGTFSVVCSMCNEAVQVQETSRGQTIECPECGSYIETSSVGALSGSDASVPPRSDEDLNQEETEEYEESEGVDRRIIVGISAVAAVVVVGLIILAAVLRSSGSRPAERPEDLRAQRQVDDTDSSTEPITPDTQPTEPIVQESPKEDGLPEEIISFEDTLYQQTKIAFMSLRRNIEIYVMNADGSEQKRLTKNPAKDMFPSWSPDGKKMAFRSERDGNWEIYVMNADGSELKRLTNNRGHDAYASWSPDGKKIAFNSNADIYVMNADGSEQKRLTNNRASDGAPSWSPDGKKIAFYSSRDGNAEIYVMNGDGTEQRRLTNNPAHDMFPFWSPDGKKIAFQSERDGNYEIYVMNADGSEQINLTNNPAHDEAEPERRAYWSPDSKKIAFRSERDGNYEIYVVNADGSELKRLTNNRGADVAPSWSPDGKKIAFQSNADIYVMNADGSKRERLTNNPAGCIQPSWSPFIPSEPRLVEEPERDEQEAVDDIDSRPQPVASDTQPTDPVEAVPLPKPDDIVTNSIGMKLVYIPAGSFMMGSSLSAAQLAREYDREENYFTDAFPQHEVRISEGFWMSQTEVTQGQYKSVMNVQPWSGKDYVREDANNPAVCVSWEDAAAFCRKLSQQEGETYRLPTEAEWEYACRAGTTTRFSFGDSDSSQGDYAWFFGNTIRVHQIYAHPVGQKKPNPWGLYDMHGNVWEWCSDWYNEDYYSNSPSVDPKGPPSGRARSLRGGSWSAEEDSLRCAVRLRLNPDLRYYLIGFRVVRSQP